MNNKPERKIYDYKDIKITDKDLEQMHEMDRLIEEILKELGVDRTKPSHWIVHRHKFIDQSTRVVYRTMEDGYTCSYCGKYSYIKWKVCKGCNSVMTNGERFK